ncbi:MAG: hypothetical protein ACRC4N_12890 [Gammaproteobacteria bacterium]
MLKTNSPQLSFSGFVIISTQKRNGIMKEKSRDVHEPGETLVDLVPFYEREVADAIK